MAKSQLEAMYLRAKNKLGIITKEELLRELNTRRQQTLDELPTHAREDVLSIERLSNRLLDIETMRDWNSYFKVGKELSTRIESLVDQYGPEQLKGGTKEKLAWISGLDGSTYRPSGAQTWGFMLNIFQPFTYFYENHWAVKAAVDCVVTEVTHDGFWLTHGKKVTAKRLREVKQVVDRLDIWNLRLEMLKDFLVYGNTISLPHKDVFWQADDPNRAEHVLSIEKFVMDKVSPIFERRSDRVVGWDYWEGMVQVPYSKDRVLHLKDKSLKNPDLGLPPLHCCVIDLESDIGASALNNTAMYKAGMVGILISLQDPEASGVQAINGSPYKKRLQQEIMSSFSGVKAGNSILVSNYVKNVHKLNNLSEFDAAFLKFREKVAIMVATALKVPPEKINMNRSSSLQYAAASLEDTVNSGFDRAISAYMTAIDRFINDKILKELCGIYDVEIQANGRYGSMNLNSARAGLIATQTGPLFDVNELRTIFYGASPLPYDEERGRIVPDNSAGRKKDLEPRMKSKENSSTTGADNPNAMKTKSIYRTHRERILAA